MKLVVSVDSVTIIGVVLTVSVVLVTGIVKMLVSTRVLESVVGTVRVDDLRVMAVDVTGQVVVLHDIKVSSSVGILIKEVGIAWEKLTLGTACLL